MDISHDALFHVDFRRLCFSIIKIFTNTQNLDYFSINLTRFYKKKIQVDDEGYSKQPPAKAGAAANHDPWSDFNQSKNHFDSSSDDSGKIIFFF